MYLFSREARLNGSNMPGAMAWAAEIAEHVTSVTGLRVSLFAEVFSPNPGTLVWSTAAADLSVLEGAFDKLMADNRYNELSEAGFGYALPGSLRDRLRAILYPTDPPPADAPLPEYVSATYSTIAGGQFARAVPIGIEIAQRATQLSGSPTAFGLDSTGNYGGAAWISFAANITELQQAEEKINADPSFVEFIDKEASTAFATTPGATTSRILRRVM